MTGLKGFGSTRHGLGANCEPGGGGLHGCALADSCVFERSQPAQISQMLAGGLANWVLPKSMVGWYGWEGTRRTQLHTTHILDQGCFLKKRSTDIPTAQRETKFTVKSIGGNSHLSKVDQPRIVIAHICIGVKSSEPLT